MKSQMMYFIKSLSEITAIAERKDVYIRVGGDHSQIYRMVN